jgi:hypothetical protein
MKARRTMTRPTVSLRTPDAAGTQPDKLSFGSRGFDAALTLA